MRRQREEEEKPRRHGGTEVGEEEVEIERIAEGGDGVGRIASGVDAGLVCFVPYTAVGERVRVRIVERKKSFARGELVVVLRASAARVAPRCRHFGDCGGCDFQHLAYDAQLAAKVDLARAALRGVAHPEIRVVSAPLPYGYRSRTKIHVQGGAVGYLARRSTRFVPIDECPVLTPGLEAQVRRDGTEASAKSAGEVWLSDSGDTGLFEQANPAMNERLVRDVVAAVRVAGSPVAELYAGSGNFTVPLAMAGEAGVAVELDGAAAARLAARLGPDAPFRVHAADVSLILPDLPATFATVLLDPPRDGAKRAIPEVLRLHPRRIIYVSCDAPTLARDLAVLISKYVVAELTLYDFMPQTAHLELLAVMDLRH